MAGPSPFTSVTVIPISARGERSRACFFLVFAVGSSFFGRDARHNPSRGSGVNVGMYGLVEAAIPRAHESRSSISGHRKEAVRVA